MMCIVNNNKVEISGMAISEPWAWISG